MNTISWRLAFASLTAVSFVAGASGAPPPNAIERGVDRIVAAGVPGAVVVVRDGERTIRYASGYGNLKPRTAMRVGDRFRVGSVTKTFVATFVLELVGEGVLSLDDTVQRWLPGLLPNGQRITVRHLLNHTSGLFHFPNDRKFVEQALRNPLREWTPREIIAVATAHKPRFAPGADWSYSDTNYFVLGLMAEAATGRSLGTELRRRIFAPLHLRATSLLRAPRIAGHHAHGYLLRPMQDVSVGSPSVEWAAGAVVSTADDLARFYHALLGGRVLPARLLAEMETIVPRSQAVTHSFGYGLGLMRVRTSCGAAWGHTGASPGYNAEALSSKDGRRQVIVLVNATGSLSGGGFFGLPPRAAQAVDRVVARAYCRR